MADVVPSTDGPADERIFTVRYPLIQCPSAALQLPVPAQRVASLRLQPTHAMDAPLANRHVQHSWIREYSLAQL